MKKTQAERDRSEERWTSIPFDSLRSGIARQHVNLAIVDPNNPRIRPTLPRLKFCDEADAS
jgi:hypothetical protein